MIRTWLTGAALLLSLVPYHAQATEITGNLDANAGITFNAQTTYYYDTSYNQAAAAGTPSSYLTQSAVGGISYNLSNDYQTLDPGTGNTGQSGGAITLKIPSIVGAEYLLTITVATDISNNGYTGDILDVAVGGTNLGTTNVVCLGHNSKCTASGLTSLSTSASSLTISTYVAPGSTPTIAITDLLEQYVGKTDSLPGQLGNSALNGGSVTSTYQSQQLSLYVDLQQVPEPATLPLLVGGLTLLASLRRRRNA